MTAPYCGLCDGAHHPRDCPATARIQEAERFAEAPRHDPVGPGDRVRVVRWHVDHHGTVDPITGLIRNGRGDVISIDDNVTVPPGTKGTVDDVEVDPSGSATGIHVFWDNGSRLKMLAGVDEWERVED